MNKSRFLIYMAKYVFNNIINTKANDNFVLLLMLSGIDSIFTYHYNYVMFQSNKIENDKELKRLH